MSRIVYAESSEAAAERLMNAATAAGLTPIPVTSLERALAEIEARDPEVLAIGPSLVSELAFELAEHVAAAGRTACVVVPENADAQLMRTALRAGVSDVVGYGEPLSEIVEAFGRASASAGRARAGSVTPLEADTPFAKVMTVFSTKGGVGKTVLATNLAVALAKGTGKRVALVDLDLEFGDVAIMLSLPPEHTIHDAVQAFDRLDAEMLAGLMEPHDSGVRALLAPTSPEDAEAISAARVGQVIDLVRSQYDYIVIDTSPSFSEAVLAALDRSDEIYVITMMDVASIKNTRISVQKLRQLGYDNGRVRLVLNRSDSKVLLEPAEVEKAVGGAITAHIPSDRIVPRSVNKGVPVILEAPRSNVSKSILGLAKDAAAPVAKEAENVA